MAATAERFNQGVTYDEYKAQMTRNGDRFEAHEGRVELDPDDVAAFKNLPQPLNVLVLAEDWCGDVINNLPVLGRLAAESGTLNLRIFLRDQNPDLMDQYLNQGQYRSIPVFAFFDDDFREIGRWIERPASVTRAREEKRREIYARNAEFGSPDAPVDQLPEEARTRLAGLIANMREELMPFSNREVIRELREIVERAQPTA